MLDDLGMLEITRVTYFGMCFILDVTSCVEPNNELQWTISDKIKADISVEGVVFVRTQIINTIHEDAPVWQSFVS